MMSVIWGREQWQLLVKGAPETLLARCRFRWSGGRAVPLTGADRREIIASLEKLASSSLRNLAVAYRNLKNDPSTLSLPPEQLERDLVWVAVLGLEDPPRPEALPAIRLCRRAGIR